MLAACGSDSSGPKTPTAAQDASYYDKLATALLVAGTSRDTAKALFVEVLNGVNADGVAPTRVTVTYNGASATWFANFGNLVDSAKTDSTQVIALWSDVNVDQVVLAAFKISQPVIAEAIATGGEVNFDSTYTLSNAFGTASGACSFTSIVNIFTGVPTYDPAQSTCLRESTTASITVAFPHDTTPTGAIRTLSLSSKTIAGVRLQFTSAAAFPSHVTPPLAAVRRLVDVR